MGMDHIYDVIVIGGGPGGYTAALYAVRAGLDTLVLEKLSAGGQMAQTTQIDNYPGFEEGIDGFSLGEKMQLGAERFGAKTELAEVYGAQLTGEVKTIETSEGTFLGRTVILATGANPRPLGIAGEQALAGRGVHYCASCDGMAYRDKTVAVIGGGNSAAADAMLLSRIAKKVLLIHRGDSLQATKIYHEPLLNTANVEVHWNSTVSELLHGDRLTGIRLKDTATGAETELPCDGVFISIGRVPATERFQQELELDSAGYVRADESTRTNLPGVFAVGDVRTKALRQVVTAVADGAVAAHYAETYLLEKG
ncbi:MAG: thioredoxin-disulfide reductase [Clostridiales bacterium]|jgi:thioredoxin reductase (NADPH)|nr:MAG: thioredoxin-disulfide reductase [Clostridiales bacterium]